MAHSLLLAAVCVCQLVLANVTRADQGRDETPPPNLVTPAEEKEGWRLLFDGKSTSGWRGYRQQAFPAKGWVVEGGALHVQKGGGGGDLATVDQFAEFELKIEWKVSKGANSGIMYRVSEEGDTPWLTGPEYQVLDDDEHADGKNPKTSAGSLYALVAPEGKRLRPVGQFNQAMIRVQQNRVEHWLNGTKVLSFELGGAGWDTMVMASKFASFKGFGRQKKGYIVLQDHGDDVWFRSIKIRDLSASPASAAAAAAATPAGSAPAAGEVRLFDGKSLTGWTCFLADGGKMEDVWSVDPEGVLICKGNPVGYIRTQADYTNFVLKLEWRFNPVTKQAGNSGVLVRMIGADKVWPKSIEAQLQSGNAGDFWNIDEFKMKTDVARTSGRNTKKTHGNEKPIGEWNEYEITVDHGTVTLKVNGQVLNQATECEEVPGKICLQSEGAEIHFRNIRLVPITSSN